MKKILLPLLLLFADISFGQVDLNLGLRAYYPFTGSANDVSGNNNNPVFNNATLTADRLGNPNSAYHFNGIDNYMRVTDNATLNMGNKMSLAIWVKPTGYYTGPCYNSMCVMKSNPATLPSNYFIRFADIYDGCTSPSTTQERFAGNNAIAATPFVQLNQWYSVVWTSDGITEKIYVNCELKASVPAGGVPYTNISDLFMGKNVDPSFPYWLDGDLDEVRIYDRALNVDEVNALGGCTSTLTCNNWLRTQAVGQHVTVGDLDITGNQVTIEANFNCSSFPVSRPDKWQDIVSKHANTTDINYVLRMDLAGVTTTTGQHLTPPPCDNLVLNKTYHVALVYDGSNLKLYRDGIVISQKPATGDLILNDWQTTIGDYAVNNPVGTNFLGYINEVRIWNVARTQAQLQLYMDAPLPAPATQTGLLAYYTFDNLLNKQGNATWNGTLNGGATINNTNPNCSFTPEGPVASANAGPDTSFCTSGFVSHVLQGSGNGSYSWSPAAYLNDPNIANPTATVNATTTFYLTVTGTPSICTGIDSVTIHVNPPPVISTIADTTVCQFSNLVLTTSSSATSFSWSPAANVSNPTIANPNYISANSARMYVTGTSAAGCSAIDSVDVTLIPSPVINTINDTVLCTGQNITLTTSGSALSYSWSPAGGLSNPNIASPVFSGTAAQTYTVTGTAGNGCTNSDMVAIDFSAPDSLKQPPSFTICQKQSILLDGNNGTRMSYLWSPATYLSNANIINPLANPPQTTIYNVLITDNTCGFDSVFTTSLTVLPPPVINARKSNDIDCAFKSATLFASGGNQYLWSPSTGLSNTTISNPVATPANTQTYTVLVTDAFGCTNTSSITVFADKTASLARYMPNAFTPDGNGLNDCYGLKNWMYIQKLQFYIFNRFGEQVFATSNPNTCWDGTYKGKPALTGTYVYVIKAQTNCGAEEQKGSFILMR